MICELQELKYLAALPSLKVLWLWDNPICQHPLYRQYIVKLLPNLMKLDNASVTSEERQAYQKMVITEKDLKAGQDQVQAAVAQMVISNKYNSSALGEQQ